MSSYVQLKMSIQELQQLNVFKKEGRYLMCTGSTAATTDKAQLYREKSYDNKPHEKCQSWKNELRELMKDFFIPALVIDSIIFNAEKEALPGETCKQVYTRGWRMFRDYVTN